MKDERRTKTAEQESTEPAPEEKLNRTAKDQPEEGDLPEGQDQAPRGGTMSLVGHLTELRKRLIICLLSFFVATIATLIYAERFTNLLLSRGSQFSFIYIAPAELMMSYIRVSLIGGVLVSIPLIIYHVWQFVRPGLRKREKLGFGVIMTLGLGLFVLGAYFAFSVVLPILLNFFARLNTTQTIRAAISIQEYISYVINTMLTFGAMFECPIVLMTLVGLGVVKPATLQKNFKFVILIVLIVAAVITPPDVTSQLLVAVPLLVLLEGSILLSQVIFRKKLRRLETESA